MVDQVHLADGPDTDVGDAVDECVDRYEIARRQHAADSIAPFVPLNGNPDRLPCLINLIKVDQEFRWEDGTPKHLEQYLEEWPELRGNDDVLVELLEAECLTQATVTKQLPFAEEIARRFPQICHRINLDKIRRDVDWEGNAGATLPPGAGSSATGPTLLHPEGEPPLVAPVLEVGERFGGYEIRAFLGGGGMGLVYRAWQADAAREVALKVIHPELVAGIDRKRRDQYLARFRDEAQATAKLHHDNLITVYEVGEIGGCPFYSMRYVEGASLKELRTAGPPENEDAAKYIRDASCGLHAAHEAGLVHRDVNPRNIIVERKSNRAIIIDFGLVKLRDVKRDLTQSHAFMGQLSYAAPEQALDAAKAKPAADVYGLGATLYFLLTDRPPFPDAFDLETLLKMQQSDPVPPRDLNKDAHQDLETICLKCLEKDPARRYLTAEAVADELDRFLRGEPIVARPPGSVERLTRWCRRNRAVAALTAAVALTLVIGMITTSLFAIQSRINESLAKASEEKAIKKTAEVQRGLIRFQVEKGKSLLDREDLLGSLPWFTEALKNQTQSQPMDDARLARTRLHSVFGQCPDLAEVLFADRPIAVAAISATGRYIAIGDDQGSAKLWDMVSHIVRTLSLSENVAVSVLSFSPDEKHLVAGGGQILHVWSLEQPNACQRLRHGGSITGALFSQDSSQVLSFGERLATVWDLANPLAGSHSVSLDENISHAALSNDKALILAVGETSAGIWNRQDRKHVPIALDNYQSPQPVPQIAPHAVAPGDPKAEHADEIRAGQSIRQKTPTLQPARVSNFHVLDARFSPDGKYVVLAGGNSQSGEVRVWDVKTGQPRYQRPIPAQTAVTQVGFSNDKNYLVMSSAGDKDHPWGTGLVWNVTQAASRKSMEAWSARRPKYVVHLSSQRLAVRFFERDKWHLEVLDPATRQVISTPLQNEDDIQDVQFSGDERRMAAVTGPNVRVCDVLTGKVLGGPWGYPAGVASMVLSPSGKWVVAAVSATDSQASTLHIHEEGTKQPLSVAVATTPRLGVPVFSADDRYLVVISGQSVQRWNLPTRSLEGEYPHPANVTHITITPNGRQLATVCSDGMARIWNLDRPHPTPVQFEPAGQVQSLRFSPQGNRIVSVSCSAMQVWDVSTGRQISPLMEHAYFIDRAEISSDGRRLLSIGRDNAQLWDSETGQFLTSALHHQFDIKHAALDQAGESLKMYAFSTPWCPSGACGGDAPNDLPPGDDAARAENAVIVSQRVTVYSPVIGSESDGRQTAQAPCVPLQQAPTPFTVLRSLQSEIRATREAMSRHARFSSNARRVIMLSRESARVWDMVHGEPLTPPLCHGGLVVHAALSRDGNFAMTAGEDKTVRVWKLARDREKPASSADKNNAGDANLPPTANAPLDFEIRTWKIALDPRPVAEIGSHAELVSGRRVDSAGQLVNLTHDELRARWQQLRGVEYAVPREVSAAKEMPVVVAPPPVQPQPDAEPALQPVPQPDLQRAPQLPLQPAPDPKLAPPPVGGPRLYSEPSADDEAPRLEPQDGLRMEIKYRGPKTALVGDTILLELTVANSGTKKLTNVKIEETFERGLRPIRASTGYRIEKGVLAWQVDNLNSRASEKFQVEVHIEAGVQQACSRVTVTADGGFAQTERLEIGVMEPVPSEPQPAPSQQEGPATPQPIIPPNGPVPSPPWSGSSAASRVHTRNLKCFIRSEKFTLNQF